MTYSATKFEVATFNRLGQENTLFDLGVNLEVRVTQIVSQYPLHHVTYQVTKFEVATSNGVGGDIFTKNMTDRQMDRLWYQYTLFSAGIIIHFFLYREPVK